MSTAGRLATGAAGACVLLLAVGAVLAGRALAGGEGAADDVLLRVPTRAPQVALTIDDGPDPQETPRILDVLAAHDAHATFFLVGARIPGHEALLARMVREGHELANHTDAETMSALRERDALLAGVARTQRLLEPYGPVRWLRPGSGFVSDAVREAAAAEGLRIALGDVHPFDAQIPSPAFSAWFVRTFARPGSVVILHDGHGRGRRTARALRRILPALAARGLEVVTLGDLVARAEGGDRSE